MFSTKFFFARQNTSSPKICSQVVAVQNNPVSLVVQESTKKCFVANKDSDSISVVDIDNNVVLTNISAFRGSGYQLKNPTDAVVHNNKLYVSFNGQFEVMAQTWQRSSGVAVFDTTTHQLIDIIDIYRPGVLAVSEAQNSVYASSKSDTDWINSLVRIDGTSNSISYGIALDNSTTNYFMQGNTRQIQIMDICVNDSKSELYALVDYSDHSVAVFYFNTHNFSLNIVNGLPSRTIIGDFGSGDGIACSSDRIYVMNDYLNIINVNDPSTRGYTDNFPSHLELNIRGKSIFYKYNFVYIAQESSDKILIVGPYSSSSITAPIQKTLDTGDFPSDIFVSENKIYITNSADDNVQIIDESC